MRLRSVVTTIRGLLVGLFCCAWNVVAGPAEVSFSPSDPATSNDHYLTIRSDGEALQLRVRAIDALSSVSGVPSRARGAWHLSGEVLDQPDSWVRISVSESGDWVSGLMRSGDQILTIQTRPSGLTWMTRSTSEARNPTTVQRVLPLSIVIDSAYDEIAKGHGRRRALALVNQIDGLFREQLGLGIDLLAARVLQDPTRDPMRQTGGTLEDLLMAFRNYRQGDTLLPADTGAVHLFSGAALLDRRMGLAYTAGVCDPDGHDVSVSRTRLERITLAHELAHTLGATHDDTSQCGQNGFLMDAMLRRDVSLQMSDCSVRAIQPLLQRGCFHPVGLAFDNTEAGVGNAASAHAMPVLQSAAAANEPVSPFVLLVISCLAVGIVRRRS